MMIFKGKLIYSNNSYIRARMLMFRYKLKEFKNVSYDLICKSSSPLTYELVWWFFKGKWIYSNNSYIQAHMLIFGYKQYSKMSHTTSYVKVALNLHTSLYDEYLKESGETQTALTYELIWCRLHIFGKAFIGGFELLLCRKKRSCWQRKPLWETRRLSTSRRPRLFCNPPCLLMFCA